MVLISEVVGNPLNFTLLTPWPRVLQTMDLARIFGSISEPRATDHSEHRYSQQSRICWTKLRYDSRDEREW